MKRYKIAFLISHPIQYNSPLFKEIAREPEIDLTVYYCSKEGVSRIKDKEFGREFAWDIPLLDGYKYKFLKNYSPFPTVSLAPFGLFNPGIAAELEREKFDALIIHGWYYVTYWIAFIAAWSSRTPVFLRSEMPLNQELLQKRWKVVLKKRLLGFLFRRISVFLAIGSENRKFLEFYGAHNKDIFAMPYAVDNKRFIEEYKLLKQDREELRKKRGIPIDAVVILFVGKLIAKKRPMDLLMAYEKVGSACKALVFAGDGPLRPELEDYSRKRHVRNVCFAGFRNQSEISEYYAMSDIFVLPSGKGETWGLVVNEAMCFNLPVIISDIVGCSSDLVKDGVNGFIYESGSVSGLSVCIGKLTGDRGLIKTMGSASGQAVAGFDYQADADILLHALRYSEGKEAADAE